MNTTVERGLERLACATVVLQRRLAYLERKEQREPTSEVRSTAHWRTHEEMATLRWVITVLTRNVNRPTLEHARSTPMPDEVASAEDE